MKEGERVKVFVFIFVVEEVGGGYKVFILIDC